MFCSKKGYAQGQGLKVVQPELCLQNYVQANDDRPHVLARMNLYPITRYGRPIGCYPEKFDSNLKNFLRPQICFQKSPKITRKIKSTHNNGGNLIRFSELYNMS